MSRSRAASKIVKAIDTADRLIATLVRAKGTLVELLKEVKKIDEKDDKPEG